MRKHSRVYKFRGRLICGLRVGLIALAFPARSSNGYPISRPEQACFGDGVVDLGLKDIEETLLADLLASLRSLEDGSGLIAEGTVTGWHGRRQGPRFH